MQVQVRAAGINNSYYLLAIAEIRRNTGQVIIKKILMMERILLVCRRVELKTGDGTA